MHTDSPIKPRIVAADEDQEFLAEAVSLLTPKFDVVATAGDGKDALDMISLYRPDAVVVGYHLPTLNGIDITLQLAQNPPAPPVVICSAETHSLIVQAAQKAGALGYVFKRFARRDLVAAVTLALDGEPFRSYVFLMPLEDIPPR